MWLLLGTENEIGGPSSGMFVYTSSNALEEGMNPSFLSETMGKIVDRTRFSNLV